MISSLSFWGQVEYKNNKPKEIKEVILKQFEINNPIGLLDVIALSNAPFQSPNFFLVVKNSKNEMVCLKLKNDPSKVEGQQVFDKRSLTNDNTKRIGRLNIKV